MTETTEAPVAAAEPSAEGTAAPAIEAPSTEQSAPAASVVDEAAEKARAESRRRAIEAEKARVKRERELREKEQSLSAKEKEIAAAREAWEREGAEARETLRLLQAAKTDPRAAMELVNKGIVDYAALTGGILQEGKPSTEQMIEAAKREALAEAKAAREEIERLRKEREDERKKAEEENTQRIVAQYRRETAALLGGDSEDYDLLRALGGEDFVLQRAAEVYQQTGKIIPPAEAAKAMEAELAETILSAAKGSAKLRRLLTEALNPPAATSTPAAPAAKPAPQAKSTDDARAKASTLTNDLVTSPATPSEEDPFESREEKLAKIKKKVADKLKEQRAAKAK